MRNCNYDIDIVVGVNISNPSVNKRRFRKMRTRFDNNFIIRNNEDKFK